MMKRIYEGLSHFRKIVSHHSNPATPVLLLFCFLCRGSPFNKPPKKPKRPWCMVLAVRQSLLPDTFLLQKDHISQFIGIVSIGADSEQKMRERENIICEPKSCFTVMFSVWGLGGDWAVKTATAGVKSITRWGLWGVACGCIKGGGQ